MTTGARDVICDDEAMISHLRVVIKRLKNVTTLDPGVTGQDGTSAKPMGYYSSRERSLALTNTEQAAMWLEREIDCLREEDDDE
jgi:hypothetical protein